MDFTYSDFESILNDETKVIEGDIDWQTDEDHSPAQEFKREVKSSNVGSLFVRASYNQLAKTLTYALIWTEAHFNIVKDLSTVVYWSKPELLTEELQHA